jgi:hypothetical protein
VVPGIDPADVRALFERRVALDGIPVLLDEAMHPVEPLSSWFRHLASMGRSPKTMCKYAYIAVRLAEFLAQGGTIRCRRRRPTCWSAGAADSGAARADLQGDVGGRGDGDQRSVRLAGRAGPRRGRPWRSDGQRRDSLRNGVARDMRVRHMQLEQYLFFRDVGLAGQLRDGTVDRSFRGLSPHRSRAAVELALLTGMQLGEWSTRSNKSASQHPS